MKGSLCIDLCIILNIFFSINTVQVYSKLYSHHQYLLYKY